MSITYDAVTDFSILNGNPNGVWTYESTDGILPAFGNEEELIFWRNEPRNTFIALNTDIGASDGLGPTISLPPGYLGLVSADQSYVEVQFTAPAAGTYVVTGVFLGIDTSEVSHDVSVALQSGDTLLSTTIDTDGQVVSFSFLVTLQLGGTVSFVNHTDSLLNTATALSATVTFASKFSWKTGVSGDWDTAANWKPAGVPGDLDSATINAAGTYTITTSADRNLARLFINKADATLAITDSTFATMAMTNRGTITVGDGLTDATLKIEGSIENSGSIVLTSGVAASATLLIGVNGATLTGGGTVHLTSVGGESSISGDSGLAKLRNINNTIVGSGLLGNGTLLLVNERNGVVEADGDLHLGNVFFIPVENRGTLRAETGRLFIESDINSGNDSVIEAVGAGRVLLDNVLLTGVTTLRTSAGGLISLAPGLTEISGTARIQGDVEVNAANNGSDTALMFEGTVYNSGTITVTSGIDGLTDLIAELQVCDGTVRLAGTGTIALGGTGGNAYIVGTFAASKLINVSNTISGAGMIGDDTMDIVNQAAGVISANIAGEVLAIDTSSHVLTNYGELSAENGAILALTGVVNCVGANAEIRAEGTDSLVVLDQAAITGTFTLGADPDAAVEVTAGASGLAGKVTLAGAINVDAAANLASTQLLLGGTITNTGTISVIGEAFDPFDPDPIVAELGIVGPTTLQGGGSVVISGGGGGNGIFSYGGYLDNVDNTIEGAGSLEVSLYNKAGGLVDANVTGDFLALLSGSARNAGTMQASNGGILAISGGLLSDAGSLIKATGADSLVVFGGVFLDGSPHLVGEDGGSFAMVGPNFAFNGLTLDGDLSLDTSLFDDFAILGFEKILTNNGTITLAGAPDDGCGCGPLESGLLVGPANGSLRGGGTIILGGDPAVTFIEEQFGRARLVNFDNSIQGAGAIGSGELVLVNQAAGTIEADVNGESMVIDTGLNAVVNRGTLKASNGGTLTLLSDVKSRGAAIIEGGTIEFQAGSQSSVSFASGTGVLELDNADAFAGTVAGFGGSEDYAMELRDIDFDNIVSTSYKSNTGNTKGVLTISDGVDTATIRLFGAFANNFTTSPPGVGYTGFVLSDDGSNGTTVNYATAPV